MSHNQPFSCYDLLISLWKCIRFIVTYILQYELSIGKSRSLPTFQVYDLIDVISSNVPLNLYMSSQCQVISHLYVMTYLFDSPNV